MPRKPITPEVAYNHAAARCAVAEYCRQDWLKKFILQGLDKDTAEGLVGRLERERYIDETRYARAFVHDKSAYNGWGVIKISQALAAKGMSREVIREAIEAMDTEEEMRNLRDLLKRKIGNTGGPVSRDVRAKAVRAAAAKGFPADKIFRALEQMTGEEEEWNYE